MYRKTMREALEEARSYRDPVNEDKGFSSQQIKMAYGVLNDPRYKQGNYSGAFKAIEKIAKGLASHPDVANALKRANEELDNDDKETIKPIIKQLQKSVKAHDKQAKQLQKDIQDEVEITEAVSDAQVAQIARMTDRNDHFGVRIEIARLMKDKQLMRFYDSLEKMHMTSQIQNAIGNDAVNLRGKLEKVLKVRMKQRFGDKDSKRIMDAL